MVLGQQELVTTGVTILSLVIGLIIGVPLSALMLWLSGRIFKQSVGYVKAIIPALIIWAVGAAFGVIISLVYQPDMMGLGALVAIGGTNFTISLALYLLLPKLMFKLEWGRGVLTGLVWWALMLGVSFVMGAIVGVFTALGIALGLSLA